MGGVGSRDGALRQALRVDTCRAAPAGVAELLGKGASAAAVDEWVAANVSPAALADSAFVRSFMLGVLRGTIPDPAVRPHSLYPYPAMCPRWSPPAAVSGTPVASLQTRSAGFRV